MKMACGAILIASRDVVEVSCLKRFISRIAITFVDCYGNQATKTAMSALRTCGLKKERSVFSLRFESMTQDFERACERRRGNVQNLRFTISAMEQLVASLKKD
jgi:hypothetical protein